MFVAMPRAALLMLVTIVAAADPCELRAQDSTVVHPLVLASAARDSGQFARAAEILRDLLTREPDNGDAARLLAQTLYWMKDVRGAAAVYEAAAARHPDDTSLRLDYARMLVETRSNERAIEILEPLLAGGGTRGRALTLLGILRYWEGDLTRAARHFREAVSADSANADARRMLEEIRASSVPWAAVESGGMRDDQQLDRAGGAGEAGIYLNPLTTLSARIRSSRLSAFDTATTLVAGAVEITAYSPGARLETKLNAGAVYRSGGYVATDWIARGSLRFRLPGSLSIQGTAERAPYLNTVASLTRKVMTHSAGIAAAVDDPRGWLGEAAVRAESYSDDNVITSAFAWALAPLASSSGARVSAGYAAAFQDARETRFSGPAARYVPYYTPEKITSHTVLASVRLRPSHATTITARGGYGFFAKETAPVVTPPSQGAPTLDFVERKFHPWDAHLDIQSAIGPAVSLAARVDRTKTAFYTATGGSLRLSWTFGRRSATR
jgi:Flp pilus assembly protein TadD